MRATMTIDVTIEVPDDTNLDNIHLRNVGAADFEAMINLDNVSVIDFCTTNVEKLEDES